MTINSGIPNASYLSVCLFVLHHHILIYCLLINKQFVATYCPLYKIYWIHVNVMSMREGHIFDIKPIYWFKYNFILKICITTLICVIMVDEIPIFYFVWKSKFVDLLSNLLPVTMLMSCLLNINLSTVWQKSDATNQLWSFINHTIVQNNKDVYKRQLLNWVWNLVTARNLQTCVVPTRFWFQYSHYVFNIIF